MSLSQLHQTGALQAVVGEPEVVEDTAVENTAVENTAVENTAAWRALKDAAIALQAIQAQDGSVPDSEDHGDARAYVETIVESIRTLTPWFPHDAEYLAANAHDLSLIHI